MAKRPSIIARKLVEQKNSPTPSRPPSNVKKIAFLMSLIMTQRQTSSERHLVKLQTDRQTDIIVEYSCVNKKISYSEGFNKKNLHKRNFTLTKSFYYEFKRRICSIIIVFPSEPNGYLLLKQLKIILSI